VKSNLKEGPFSFFNLEATMYNFKHTGTVIVALIILAAFTLPYAAPAARTDLIPREIIFGNPVKASPQISPDGTMMAYLAPVENVLNVWVKTVGKDDDRPVTKDTNRGIRNYFWASDNHHMLYLQDVGGNENWRLYGVDLGAGAIKDYTPYDSVQVRVTAREKHFPNELLIEMNKDNRELHDVYHLDLTTSELRPVAKNPGNVIGWVADANFKVRGALMSTADGGFDLMIRDTEESEWRKLVNWDNENNLTSGPVSFTKDGRGIFLMDSRNVNASRLTKMDLASGKQEVIAEDPEYDVSNALVHPDTYEIQAVAFDKDRTAWTVLDKSIKKDFDGIAKLTRGDFNVYDRDDADRTWLVGFTADNGSPTYWAWDRKKQQGIKLFSARPELDKYTLATMEPIQFKTRDGLTVHAYLTLPANSSGKNLPLVLNVHGGPWTRDGWGYDGEAQWLANRGYACLQVNYRGSTGYGKKFLNAGDREWGGKMHNDLVDAVNWAIAKGLADPQKVAIYGGSYGGYAALVGATFTPDLFCCAVDIVGPSNLITFLNSVPPYWATLKATFHKRIGDPEKDAEFLKSRSPLFKVDNIKIPMLIAQGANDPRVNQAESEQVVEAMKQKGIKVEYMLFPDEGHGFAKPENRLKFYGAAEKFLAQYLGGRYEEPAN
jgi:dipeptidyl aminopeptidase/acylaminoacyl peptidase